jgi:hypothetical protein
MNNAGFLKRARSAFATLATTLTRVDHRHFMEERA